MGVSLKRQLSSEDITCPAGVQGGDAGCFCRIERVFIDGRLNPSSIEEFCAGDYLACPTWRADKEMVWAQGKGIDLPDDGADLVSRAQRERAA